jgi:hypothetical protein
VTDRQAAAGDYRDRLRQARFAHKAWIEHDSDLATLHDHPRYQALLQRL